MKSKSYIKFDYKLDRPSTIYIKPTCDNENKVCGAKGSPIYYMSSGEGYTYFMLLKPDTITGFRYSVRAVGDDEPTKGAYISMGDNVKALTK